MLKISIITVCYNNVDTLEDTIKSVQSQSYPEIEYIVVDGASKDGTLEIIEKYKSGISKFVSEKDNGIYFAINKGIRMATGDIIGILHGDDLYTDNTIIAKVAATFEKSGADCVYGDLQYVDRANPEKITRSWVAGEYKAGMFLKGWMPPHPTFFIRKECIEKHGDYNTTLFQASDYEFMLRMIHKHQLKIHYLPEVLVKMKIGGASNKSVINRIKNNVEDRKAWKINNLKPSVFTLFIKPLSKIGQFFKG
ncbi:MAG TPA: glycosyltransferase family 2 protein [Bacteroidia bacterium]|jgi:glycosyltransferase involved in cell wall biosynthesis|nr:glycosyltransferase family 2 protein [Bacteroidia bacterium]